MAKIQIINADCNIEMAKMQDKEFDLAINADGLLVNCARCGEMFLSENDDEYLCEFCQEMED